MTYFPIIIYFTKDKQFKFISKSEDLPIDKEFTIIQTTASYPAYLLGVKMINVANSVCKTNVPDNLDRIANR